MTDYTELKRLAVAAPSGPWIAENDSLYFKDDGYTRHLLDADAGHDVEDEAYYAALKFIATANPAAVLALLAENETLRKDAERWRFFSVLANDLQAFPHSWGQMTPEKMDYMCDEAMAAAMSKESQP
ncbi:hypothetical protein [Pseudomonas rhizophila]